ncbi:MAG: hypothetical protein RR238_01605 [Lachnospiraceae bacterium]
MKKTTTVIATVIGILGGFAGGIKLAKRDDKVYKFKTYYNVLNQWLNLKQEGKTVEKYFTDNDYKSIAIYGMGEMGNRLYEDLKGTSIEVKYAIDKNIGSTYSEIKVVEPDDELEEVDAVIVSAIFAFEAIERELCQKISCPIISLEDIIFDI